MDIETRARKRLDELKAERVRLATTLAQFDAAIGEIEALLAPEPVEQNPATLPDMPAVVEVDEAAFLRDEHGTVDGPPANGRTPRARARTAKLDDAILDDLAQHGDEVLDARAATEHALDDLVRTNGASG